MQSKSLFQNHGNAKCFDGPLSSKWNLIGQDFMLNMESCETELYCENYCSNTPHFVKKMKYWFYFAENKQAMDTPLMNPNTSNDKS